jgi:hypothetical protein
MSNKKIGCLFLHLSNDEGNNYKEDTFFAPNAINSFKKYHPNIDIHHITNDNFSIYLKDLGITEYYDSLGLVRIYIIKELLRQKGYDKIIMLGLDTFTCAYLDDFINNNEDDLICSSGPPYDFIKTQYWAPKVIEFEHEGKFYRDVDFINADVACFNKWEAADILINKSIEFWTDHCEQGGMNYLRQNQESLDIKVGIVDFPYIKSQSLYNVRSKGMAHGGNQMYQGNLYNGNYKDPNSRVIGDVYPTSTYHVRDNKLFTHDNKQIKVFHYAEALGVKTKDEYNETIYEMKNVWFNNETKKFLIEECNMKF